MTRAINRSQWWRLMNPLATRRPPALGSQPEIVISVPVLDMLLINDDWQQTARQGRIAIGTTDGTRIVQIKLDNLDTADGDYLVFLAHPNRLWVRTIGDVKPPVGSWMADDPTAAITNTEVRRGQTIRKATR